jgi:hypothetical protein
VQRSHSGRHPPVGAQRFTPSPVAAQTREQHALASLQMSPTCFAQLRPSFIMHPATGAQRSVPLGSGTQRPLQQSAAVLHVSPSTRQAWSSAHRRTSPSSTHDFPQQSLSSAHDSPAGRQPGPAAAQVPLKQVLEQQSLGAPHDPPAEAHVPDGVHAPAAHASEQQAPARSQVPDAPTHPVVGRHVVSRRVSSAQ